MGHRVGCVQAPAGETQGVNDRWQLALAERELRNRTNRHWLLNGVTMLDPRQTFIDVTVQLGRDVTIYPGTILQGETVVGDGSEIGPNTQLDDCIVGAGEPRRPHRRTRRRGRRGCDGRAVRIPPTGFVGCRGGHDRSVLHCEYRSKPSDTRPGEGQHMEKVTTKSLALYSGRTHPALAEEVATHLGQRARRSQHRRVRQRRDPAAIRRERARQRRVHHADPLRRRRALDQRFDHRAADHDRRRLSGVGETDHRRLPVLRIRPPGPQGRGSRADHGPPRRRHVQGGRRQAHDLDRPPLRPDPGLLRRARRSPHGDAGAREVHPRAGARTRR